MSSALPIDLMLAHLGELPGGGAVTHGRADLDGPAATLGPRPAERALGTTSLALHLAFDSFREPVPAGHRGGGNGGRHLVYISRDYAVDVYLPPAKHEPEVLRGELLSRRDGPVAEVPTFLLDGDRIAGYDRTGSLGEFRLETEGAVDPRLCLLLDTERCIEVPIGIEATGRAAAERPI